jgi:LDH2 family malate/lactate/ureidoglycolate dehydrogenase
MLEQRRCASLRVSSRALRAWLAALFRAAGLAEGDAALVARNLAEAEQRGVLSHGLLLVPMYAERIARRIIDPDYALTVVHDAGASLLLDGGGGPGQSIAFHALELARERAARHGIALVNVRNGNHVGMLATYGLEAARAGQIALITTNAGPSVGAHGARGTVLGNNALCFAFPQAGREPLCFDMATGAVATGKVRVAQARGAAVPAGWVVDAHGAPSDDPTVLERGGWVLPVGGHKGFGLSVVTDVLTAVLAGAAPSVLIDNKRLSPGKGVGLSHTFIVIDPQGGIGRDAFAAGVAAYADVLRAVMPLDPARPVRAPGDPELERAAAQVDEIELDGALYAPAVAAAHALGVGDVGEYAGA